MDIFKILTTVDSETTCVVCKSTNAIVVEGETRRCKACKATFDKDGARVALSSIETIITGNLCRLMGMQYSPEEKLHRLCVECAAKLPSNNRCLYAFRDAGPCAKCEKPCDARQSVAYKGALA